MIKDDFSSDNMDLIFEEIMNSGVISKKFDERLSKESLLSEKLDDLKIVTKQASDMELDFLLENLDYLINTLMQNDRVRRDYEYRKELRKTI